MPEQPTETAAPAPTLPPRAALPNRRWTWSTGNINLQRHVEEAVIAEPLPSVPNFIPSNDFNGYCSGWPLLAKEQGYYVNGSLHRRFGWERQLLLHYEEARINQISKELKALHHEEAAHDASALRSLTPWQLGTIEGDEHLLRRDKLMHELGELLNSYTRTCLQDVAMRQRPRCRMEAVDLLRYIDNTDILDDEARSHFLEIDDFTTTKDLSEAIPNFVGSLIYGPKGTIADILMKPFVNKKKMNSPFETYYLHGPMKQTFTALSASVVLMMMLAPIGILYFVEPSKAISFSVVVIFAATAAWVISKLPGARFETVFIAAAAYMAIQVTFLANFQGACTVGRDKTA